MVQRGEAGNSSQQEMFKSRDLHIDWDFPSIPLADLMGGGGNSKPRAEQLSDIVFLGGKFSDIHPTPFGAKLGIELSAAAVETEMAGKTEPLHVRGSSQWVLKILLALGIAWLNSRLMPMWAAMATMLLIALVFVASFVGIYYGLFRMEFLPFIIGIWIEQLIEGSERAQHASQVESI